MAVPTSSYNPIIPQPTDPQSVSQGDLLNNFGAIETYVDVNHYDFGASSTLPGKHFIVGLPVQGTNPPTNPSTAITYVFEGSEIGVYNFLSDATSQQELYVAKTNSLGVVTTTVPMTAGQQVSAAGFTNPGFSYLPSGYLLKWGIAQLDNIGSANINLNLFGPPYTNVFNVQVTYFSVASVEPLSGVAILSPNFTVLGEDNAFFYFFSIGN
jgi:hypothetical protein